MRMLFPEPVEGVDPATVYADVPHNDFRPAVRLNMIVSVDGGTSWDGVSGALGGSADKALFSVLRSLADVVLVASATMRGEHYGPPVLAPKIQDARRERGQTPVPRIAVVSRTCQFDWSTPFFTAATERPIVFTVSSASEADRTRAAQVAEVIVAGEDDVDLPHAVGELGSRGAESVLVEGGPTLNGELARAGLLDELCVTLSPLLASGDAKRIIAGSTLDAATQAFVPSPSAAARVIRQTPGAAADGRSLWVPKTRPGMLSRRFARRDRIRAGLTGC